MGPSPAETIEEILSSVQDEVTDSDLKFKLRTARQLNIALMDQQEVYRETLEEADIDEEIRENLRELGYL